MKEPLTQQEKAEAYDDAIAFLLPEIKEKLNKKMKEGEMLLHEAIAMLNGTFRISQLLPLAMEVIKNSKPKEPEREPSKKNFCSFELSFRFDNDGVVSDIEAETDNVAVQITFMDTEWKVVRNGPEKYSTLPEFCNILRTIILEEDRDTEVIIFSVVLLRLLILIDLSGTRDKNEINRYSNDIIEVVQAILVRANDFAELRHHLIKMI